MESMCGVVPPSSSATRRPVAGAIDTPSMLCPAAISTLDSVGLRSMIGRLSGGIGRKSAAGREQRERMAALADESSHGTVFANGNATRAQHAPPRCHQLVRAQVTVSGVMPAAGQAGLKGRLEVAHCVTVVARRWQ